MVGFIFFQAIDMIEKEIPGRAGDDLLLCRGLRLIILGLDLEIALGVLADRAEFRSLLADYDVAAV